VSPRGPTTPPRPAAPSPWPPDRPGPTAGHDPNRTGRRTARPETAPAGGRPESRGQNHRAPSGGTGPQRPAAQPAWGHLSLACGQSPPPPTQTVGPPELLLSRLLAPRQARTVLYAWLILAGPTTIVDPDSPDRSTSIAPNEANRFRSPGGGRGAPPAAARLLVKRCGLCHHGSSRADDLRAAA
jgi:hypothetical protein